MHETEILKKSITPEIIITIVIILGLSCYFSYSVYLLNQTSIYLESGPIENIQVFILTIACLVFLLPVIRQTRTDKLLLLFFAFLCLSFILREVDIEYLDIPNVLKFLGAGIGRKVMLVIGFIGMLFYAMLNMAHYKNILKLFFVSKEGVLIIMAGMFLYIGSFFEKTNLVQHRTFFEEMSELIGYLLILLAALALSKNSTTNKVKLCEEQTTI